MKTFYFELLSISASLIIAAAQVPANGDVKVFGKMHVAAAEEKLEFFLSRKKFNEEQNSMVTEMEKEEEAYERQRLTDAGSMFFDDGSPILANQNALQQVIDPRTPAGFGNPFFRQIHVEQNQEMDLSDAILADIDGNNVTSDIDMSEFDGIDTSEFYDDLSPVIKTESIYSFKMNIENNDLAIEWKSHVSRDEHKNGTTVDTNTTVKCRNMAGIAPKCTESVSFVNSYWEGIVDPFPDGICPIMCDCLKGVIKDRQKRIKKIDNCKKVCEKTDVKSVIRCATYKKMVASVEKMILTLFQEKLGGFTPGVKIQRNHPLGADLRRFIGTF